jgi:hypothetical protein
MSLFNGQRVRRASRARKTSLRGHGSFVGGTANDMPPPPEEVASSRRGFAPDFPVI